MLVLAIDTSTPAVTAGMVRLDDAGLPRLVAERVTVDALAHAELLAPQLRQLLADARPDALVCGAGPGPFTGLRVGMVTAAALGDGLGIPVHGVCSLDALASDITVTANGGRVLVATDARRREVYWAVYQDGRRLDGPHVQRPAELATLLAELGVRAAAGAGAEQYADLLGLPLLPPRHPSPVGLVAVAAEVLRAGAQPQPLVPLYLRRPDAAEPRAPKRVTAAHAGGGRP